VLLNGFDIELGELVSPQCAPDEQTPKSYVIKFVLSGLERSYVFSTVSYLHRSCEKFTRLQIRQVITVQYLDVDRSQNA